MAPTEALKPQSVIDRASHSDAPSAMKLFIRASMTCPASVTGQAAIIALHCQRTNLDPEKLRISLLDRSDLVLELIRLAENVHEKKGKTPAIDEEQVRDVIAEDFLVAKDMLDLEPQDLEQLAGPIYQGVRRRMSNVVEGEIEMYRNATRMKSAKRGRQVFDVVS